MKKATRQNIMDMISQQYRTQEQLTDLLNTLTTWRQTHEKKGQSFHWSPPLRADDRRREEALYTMDQEIAIGSVKIHYVSDLYVSCNHYYWTDKLTCTWNDNNIFITFGDIEEIIDYAIDCYYSKFTITERVAMMN